jgi:hypothetical protein
LFLWSADNNKPEPENPMTAISEFSGLRLASFA